MKYFIYYLPIEGKIQQGDWLHSTLSGDFFRATSNADGVYDSEDESGNKDFVRCAPFLCEEYTADKTQPYGLPIKLGQIPYKVNWLKDGQEVFESDMTYSEVEQEHLKILIEELEKTKGWKLGTWIKDREDGYKLRYQGQIFDFRILNGVLNIKYASKNGGSWGQEKDLVEMTAEQIEANEPSPYFNEWTKELPLVHFKCPCCEDWK